MTATGQQSEAKREVRLALVLNGGVSLAVWMGGVTREIDNARLASQRPTGLGDTAKLYQELLGHLRQTVVVDVVAGASAGGINGILLAGAIATGKPLPNLRETWIGVGDIRTLVRSPSEANPPSILKGDDVVLEELRGVLESLFSGTQGPDQSQPHLYLYVTATDVTGRVEKLSDSTGHRFDALDPRRVLAFQFEPDGDRTRRTASGWRKAVTAPDGPVDLLEPDAWQFLARAARSTSSFPVAFEPYELKFADTPLAADGSRPSDWLIDGGVLDNQPFTPVLDRIGGVPASRAVKRVLGYITPYADNPGSIHPQEGPPNARQSYEASGGLPREIPKLEALDRLRADLLRERIADDDRKRLSWTDEEAAKVREAALPLFTGYQLTRYAASLSTFRSWASDSFRPGNGANGQDPTDEWLPDPPSSDAPISLPTPLPDWIPQNKHWSGEETYWHWGLSPAERVASWALLFLREQRSGDGSDPTLDARKFASALVWYIRKAKSAIAASVADGTESPTERANAAFTGNLALLNEIQTRFVTLDTMIAEACNRLDRTKRDAVPSIKQLLYLEVVRNAFSIQDIGIPYPFEFLFMSAGVGNSLLSRQQIPDTASKLVGVQLRHFGGFLKRSWRANDWLWGRMDGVEHVLRAIVDLEAVRGLNDGSVDALAKLAFGTDDDATILAERWESGLMAEAATAGFARQLRKVQRTYGRYERSLEAGKTRDAATRRCIADARLKKCRQALAARFQLEIIKGGDDDDLVRVAEAALEDVDAGASKIAEGAMWADRLFIPDGSGTVWPRRPLTTSDRLEAFRSLHIAEKEHAADELSSRFMLDVGSRLVAVGTALVAGDRGGLPLPARSALATARGVTLALSSLARLLAIWPVIGAGILAFLTGVVIWGFLSPSTLLGSLVPLLTVLVVAGGAALLTIATSAFEGPFRSAWKWIWCIVLLLVPPLAFGLIAGWGGTHLSWLDRHLLWEAIALAAVLVLGWTLASFVGPPFVPPLAFGLFVGWASTHMSWLDTHFTREATHVAAVLAFIAAAAAAVRIAFELVALPKCWRRLRYVLAMPGRHALGVYRIAALLALLTLAGGYLAVRWEESTFGSKTTNNQGTSWSTIADEHKGTILIAALLATFFLSGILVEVVVPAFRPYLDNHRAKKRGQGVTG